MGISCRVIRNPKNNEIEAVEAPNGDQSILFREAQVYTQNKEEALDLWAVSYIDEFKERYGNSEVSKDFSSPIEVSGAKVFYKERVNPITEESTGEIELDLIESTERGKGNAKRAMREFLEYADSQGKDVFLTVSPRDKQTSFEGLINFYESFGFRLEDTGFEMTRKAKRNVSDGIMNANTNNAGYNFLDKNGEAKLEHVLDFLKQNEEEVEAEPMTNQEIIEVKNILRAKSITASDLKAELSKIVKGGNVDFKELDMSSVLNSAEKTQIKNNSVYQGNLIELSKKDIELEDTVGFRPEFVVLDGTVNKYGMYNIKNPLDVEQDIKEQVAGITNIEEFETAFMQLPYTDIVEKFINNEIFAYEMFAKFSQMSRIEVLDNTLENINIENKLTEVENSMDISKLKTSEISMLLETSNEVWKESQEEIEEALSEIQDRALEAGLDLENLSDTYVLKSKQEITTLLESLLILKRNTSIESLNLFLDNYKEFYNIEVTNEEFIKEMPLQHRNKALVKVDDYALGEYEAFNRESLIKLEDGIYQKVEKVSVDNLYEMVYEQAVNNDNRLLPTVAYFNSNTIDNQKLKNIANKEEVINNIKTFINSEVSSLDLGTAVYDFDAAEQMLLFKYYFDAPVNTVRQDPTQKELKAIDNFSGDEFYLNTEFPTVFQVNKLKEKNKNSEAYKNFYSRFTIDNSGIKLIEENSINVETVMLGIPENIKKDFVDYSTLSRNSSMNKLVEVDNAPSFISNSTLKNYYQNSPMTLKPFKGDYQNIDQSSIVTNETSVDFLRVGNRLFQKTQEESSHTFYREIPTNIASLKTFSEFRILNKFAQNQIKPYIRSQEEVENNSNLYTSSELESINNKHFDCN